jgi:hypothetical protein
MRGYEREERLVHSNLQYIIPNCYVPYKDSSHIYSVNRYWVFI